MDGLNSQCLRDACNGLVLLNVQVEVLVSGQLFFCFISIAYVGILVCVQVASLEVYGTIDLRR